MYTSIAKALVCTLGQATYEVRHQRPLAVAKKIMRDQKKARKVIIASSKVLQKEKKYLFGTRFTAGLVTKLKNTKKLRDSLRGAGLGRRGGRGGRQSYHGSRQQQHGGGGAGHVVVLLPPPDCGITIDTSGTPPTLVVA